MPSSRRTSGPRSLYKAKFKTCFDLSSWAPFFNGVTILFLVFRSPDAAQRNPGRSAADSPRITLHFIRDTSLIACTSDVQGVKESHLAPLESPINISKHLFAMSIACIALQAQAHGGRTNAEGCHNDRKNGGYHCHNGSASNASTRSSLSNNASSSTQSKRSGKTYYPNCAAVRADGAAPLRRGEPGYASHLDRDNDGVACE